MYFLPEIITPVPMYVKVNPVAAKVTDPELEELVSTKV